MSDLTIRDLDAESADSGANSSDDESDTTENGETFDATILDGSIVEHRGDVFATVIPSEGKGRGGVVQLPEGYETRTGVSA